MSDLPLIVSINPGKLPSLIICIGELKYIGRNVKITLDVQNWDLQGGSKNSFSDKEILIVRKRKIISDYLEIHVYTKMHCQIWISEGEKMDLMAPRPFA